MAARDSNTDSVEMDVVRAIKEENIELEFLNRDQLNFNQSSIPDSKPSLSINEGVDDIKIKVEPLISEEIHIKTEIVEPFPKCTSCDLTLQEIHNLSLDWEKLREFVLSHGLILPERECPTCHRMAAVRRDWYYTCRRVQRIDRSAQKRKAQRVQCTFHNSSKVGTWFDNSRMKVEDVVYFVAMWCLVPFPRQAFICRELRCSRSTVVNWSSFCREVAVYWATENSAKLGGPGLIVEIDEAKFGKRKYNSGCKVEGQWVFGGFERDTKRIFLVPVEQGDAATLLEVIQEWIEPGTTIVSDCWKRYDTQNHDGFQQWKINHSVEYVNPRDRRIHTQNIEQTWRDVRGGTPRYKHRENHSIGYLAEFMFKRHFTEHTIHHLLMQAAALYPPLV